MGQRIKYYLGALSRIKEFINKFYIKNSLPTDEIMNVLNFNDYLPDLNVPHVDLTILSDTISLIKLIDFSKDCEIILLLKNI